MEGLNLHFPSCSSVVIAYGSGVFSQGRDSDADKSRLVDLIIATDDAEAWHRINMERHAMHYPWILRAMGAAGIARFQRWGGAHILFFPMVRVGEFACKYGVIETRDLLYDLTHWNTLYCAGRLHKPVKFLKPPQQEPLQAALRTNLGNALRVSLLHASMQFPGQPIAWRALFERISNLSYAGDVRMGVGEDPRKVSKIVDNNLERFAKLYNPHVDELLAQGILESHSKEQLRVVDMKGLAKNIPLAWQNPKELERVVKHVSITQTAKGIVSAGWASVVVGCAFDFFNTSPIVLGPYRSLLYGARKIGKRFL